MNKPNNEQPMTTAEAIAYVRNYQLWRRGDSRTFDEAGLNPTTLGKAIDSVLDAAERAESAEAEGLEQARLLGMSAERECGLRAKLEAAEAEKLRLVGQIATMHDEHEAAEARVKVLGEKYDEWARLYADQGARLRAVTEAGDILRNAAVMAMDENKDYPALDKAIIRWDAAIDAALAQAGKEAQP